MKELEQRVIRWAEAKGIFAESTPDRQLDKTEEEVAELRKAIAWGNFRGRAEEELGDCLVTLAIVAAMIGADLEKCLEQALDKIEKRKGRMVGGFFVKDGD